MTPRADCRQEIKHRNVEKKRYTFQFQTERIQEAQLSPTDRATLHVIEYFAKSLMVTQGQSINQKRIKVTKVTNVTARPLLQC